MRSKIFEKNILIDGSNEYIIYTQPLDVARAALNGPTAWFKKKFEKYNVQLETIYPLPCDSRRGVSLTTLAVL